MSYPCIERTYDIATGGICIRLWVNMKELCSPEITDILEPVLLIVGKSGEDNRKAIFEAIHKEIPNVNAIQIKGRRQEDINKPLRYEMGEVVYLVDFEKDPHG